MRENLIREKHCGTLGGHFGIDKTLELVRRNYHWPRLPMDVKKFFDHALFSKGLKELGPIGVSINHFLSQQNHGIV